MCLCRGVDLSCCRGMVEAVKEEASWLVKRTHKLSSARHDDISQAVGLVSGSVDTETKAL